MATVAVVEAKLTRDRKMDTKLIIDQAGENTKVLISKASENIKVILTIIHTKYMNLLNCNILSGTCIVILWSLI